MHNNPVRTGLSQRECSMLSVWLLISACAPKEAADPDASPSAEHVSTVSGMGTAAAAPLPEPEAPAQPEPEAAASLSPEAAQAAALPSEDAPLVVEVPDNGMEKRKTTRRQHVYREPDGRSRQRALLEKGATFPIVRRVSGPGCEGEGWGEMPGGGFVCLRTTEPSDEPLYMLPKLVEFVHPAPADWETYSTEGIYSKDPASRPVPGLVPYVYAKVWRRWKGPVYSSADAYASGAAPRSYMEYGYKFRFTEAIETERGTVLKRDSGEVVPVDDIFLYPVSYFHGRELDKAPLPAGMLPAWVFGYEGGEVRATPDKNAEVVKVLDYHMPLLVRDQPADATGHWWEIPDALGPGVPGYVNDQRDIRHWVPREPPAEISAGEVWIDVDLGQQVLALMEGDQPLFVTMVSTGDVGWETPQGIFRVYDKMIETTMSSKPDAEDADFYFVEGVPWTMHFKPRYALHGVFWHWGFGHRASHGCVNLAPRDARYVFDHIGPTMEAGWHTVYETPADPGALLRIRSGDGTVNDRRASLK